VCEQLKHINQYLYEEVSYFLYEAPYFYDKDEWCRITSWLDNQVEEVIRNDTEAIIYILKQFKGL